MDFEHKGIFLSVKNITGEVLKLSIYKVDGGERLLLHELNKQMIEELKIVGRPEMVKSEQSHPLGDDKKPFTGGQK